MEKSSAPRKGLRVLAGSQVELWGIEPRFTFLFPTCSFLGWRRQQHESLFVQAGNCRETQGKLKVRRQHWPSWLARDAVLPPNGAL